MASNDERDLQRGRRLKRVGLALLVLGVIGAFALRLVPLEGAGILIAIILGPLPIIAGALVWYRGRQYTARGQAVAVSRDSRPPVVYLRPFAKDASTAGQVLPALLWVGLLGGLKSAEEQLSEAVAPIGPLVAIGRPGEKLPKPGAARAYADDQEWRAVVDKWLSVARLVILRPGNTMGLWWEMERAVRTVPPDRFLLLMHDLKPSAYASFAERVQADLGIELPRFPRVPRWLRLSTFLEFDANWRASVLPLRSPYWRTGPRKPMVHAFHYALRPVFEKLGIDWQPSPISIAKVISVICVCALGLFLLAVFLSW